MWQNQSKGHPFLMVEHNKDLSMYPSTDGVLYKFSGSNVDNSKSNAAGQVKYVAELLKAIKNDIRKVKCVAEVDVGFNGKARSS